MTAEAAKKRITRVVVCASARQLKVDYVFPIARSDFAHSHKELDEWKASCVADGGLCLYDGKPQT